MALLIRVIVAAKALCYRRGQNIDKALRVATDEGAFLFVPKENEKR